MEWFSASDDWLSRWVFERGLAITYVIAFAVVLNQFRPLLGEHGLLPVPRFVAAVPFRRSPSLFHWRYSDRLVVAVGLGRRRGGDRAPARGPAAGRRRPWRWRAGRVLWVLYLSVVNVGQRFYSFGWESLLLEVGFLACFLGGSSTEPPVVVMFLLRWLLFRLELGAGLIKLRGDPCWRDLTCLEHHHETQPMPGPLSAVLPPPPQGAAPRGGARQPHRPARGAVVPVRARAAVDDRGGDHRRHPGLPDDQRQLLVAQLPHHRASASR